MGLQDSFLAGKGDDDMKLNNHLSVESKLRRRGALLPQSYVPYWLCDIYAFVTFMWSATAEWALI